MGSLLNTIEPCTTEITPQPAVARAELPRARKHSDSSRYELKYIIEEPRAHGVCDFVRPYLQRDRYARPEMAYSYPIYTLYLDGPGLMLYTATCQGHKNRYKLRIRYYENNPNSPLYFEIKRRVGDVIIKERTTVRPTAFRRLVEGGCPMREDLTDTSDADDYMVLKRFCELRAAIDARPRILVHYIREAWVAPHDSKLRVSFDRQLASARYEGQIRPPAWLDASLPSVVLELKFNDRFPSWMQDLVQNWDLYRSPMAKYVHCTDQLLRSAQPLASARPLRSPYE